MTIDTYARVSTQEQATHGLSIETQLENLRAWAKANGHTIAGEYVDAGISGKKPLSKRPALLRWIHEVEAGRKVDALVFTKLDRFFRSVKNYYQVTAIMDAHKIGWQAIQEDYETITSAGRFKVNIMLAIAESEADRTSERIKVVFDGKVARGEHLGNPVPFGFDVVDKHLVPNADAELVRGAFEMYKRTGSIYKAKDYMFDMGHPMVYPSVYKLLHNPIYAGRYRDNFAFCPPIIPPEEFDEIQVRLTKRSIRSNTRRTYLFSGLLRCAVCGHSLGGAYQHWNNKELYQYRCPWHLTNGRCPNKKRIRETAVEEYLLDHIGEEFQNLAVNLKRGKKSAKVPDKAAILAKVERLNELYVEGLVEKEKYLSEREKLMAQIPAEAPTMNLDAMSKIILAEDFRERYNDLSKEDRRSLWRSLLDHVDMDEEGNLTIFFPSV